MLMVRATNGFRHGPAIRAQKEIMTALSATTEFRVDTTEDLTRLNPDNLVQYDVLFFANSTLRAPRPEGAPVVVESPLEGALANNDVELLIPDDKITGKLALSGDPSALTGMIMFRLFPDPAALADVTLDQDTLSFNCDAEGAGQIDAMVLLKGDRLSGTVSIMNGELPIVGVRSAPEPTAWSLTLNTPQGTMEAVLTLAGEESGEIEFPDGARTLQDMQVNETQIMFRFDVGDFGMIDALANIDGDTMSGTFSVGAGSFPFTGSPVDLEPEPEIDGPLITEEQQAAIMGFLREGKGIALAHAGLDAFYNWDEYRTMAGGGLFTPHPWTQSVRVTIDEPDIPATKHWCSGHYVKGASHIFRGLAYGAEARWLRRCISLVFACWAEIDRNA